MATVVGALVVGGTIRRTAFGGAGEPSVRVKMLAAVWIALWAAAITGGRLLAYTNTRLLVSF